MTGRLSAAELVRDAGKSIPTEEAEFILGLLLRKKRHELYSDKATVPARARRRFAELVLKARDGFPAQYLVHDAPFLDFSVYVDERVLIPRPETEELVLRAASRLGAGKRTPIASRQSPILVVDYGTGSGCIAIALARMFPESRVLAVDSSGAALSVCRRNVRRRGIEARITPVRANSLDHPGISRISGRLDLLISNPPYVPTPRLEKLDPKVRNHEPLSALDGGPKGISILAMLLERGLEMLAAGGLLALEIDASQPRLLLKLAPDAVIERDLAGRPRYLFLKKEA